MSDALTQGLACVTYAVLLCAAVGAIGWLKATERRG